MNQRSTSLSSVPSARRMACYRRVSVLLFLLVASFVGATAAEGPTPVHKADGSFIRDWLVLGPFPGKSLGTDFLAGAGGEANVRPKEGDVVTASDGKRLTWTRLKSTSDNVSLEGVLGIQEWSVAYVYCELASDQAAQSALRTAYEGNGAGITLNGEQVGNIRPHVDRNLDIHAQFPVNLKAGRNACLIKLAVAQREWTFMFQPLPPSHATVDIIVTEAGRTNHADALVELFEGANRVARLTTDETGKTSTSLYPLAEAYDIRVTSGESGAWLTNARFQVGEHRRLEIPVRNAVFISGHTSAMDGTPQSGIVVEALAETGKAAETVLSDASGAFRFVNLRSGRYKLRCQGPSGFIVPSASQSASTSTVVGAGEDPQTIDFVFPEARKGVWKSYVLTQGLSEVRPRRLHRTPEGFLWIGTSSAALFQFDGVEFRLAASGPAIPGIDVLSLDHDRDGVLWIGTSSGVSRQFAGRTQNLPIFEKFSRNAVNDILVDPDNTIWFATRSGLAKYDGKNLAMFTVKEGLPSNAIISLCRTRDGSLHMLTQSGLVRFDGREFKLVQPFQRLTPRNVGGGAKDGRYSVHYNPRLHEARDGALWFGTQFDGAYRFDGKALSRLGRENGLPSDYITSIAETSDGALWFASPEGLSRFDGRTVLNYTDRDGLISTFVTDIQVDPDDVIWCATRKGLSRFDATGFLRFTKEDGLRNRDGETAGVMAIEPEANGNLLLGTEWGGLLRVNGHRIEPATTNTDRPYVRKIYRAADGAVWLGMPKGIFRYQDGETTQVLERSWILALSGDREGNLWYGQGWNGGGLSRFNPKTGEEKVFRKPNGLPNESVWAIEPTADGAIWVGTSGGLGRYREGRVENLRDKGGLTMSGIFSFRRDAEDALWVASSQGLHRIDSVSRAGTNFHVTSITVSNGLPDQHIWCSARTADGVLWMGTDRNGLLGYDGKAVTVLDKRDGLLGNQVLALTTNADGSLWVGTLDGGLNRYKPSKVRPSIRLREVKLDDQAWTNSSAIPDIQTGQRVTLQYQEVDQKTHPEKRQFSYRLLSSTLGS